jgi:hypothetical protein
MGRAGRRWVEESFSVKRFRERLATMLRGEATG